MNRTTLLILTAAVFLAACGVTAGFAQSDNTNTTLLKPIADTLLSLERRANVASFMGDAKFFEGMLSDRFVMLGPSGSRVGKAAVTEMVAGVKCNIKDGWKLDEPRLSAVDANTYVLTYKGTFDGACTENGETDKVPSPIRAATVWVRSGGKWLAAFHGENLIVDTSDLPPAKPEAGKEGPKKDDKTLANSNTAPDTAVASKATRDAKTDALVKVELAVWEAWKARDAKTLEELTAKDLAFVDIFGNVTSTKADTIRVWSDHRCEIKSVRVTDGFASAVSSNVMILTHKGEADGTCYGQKVPPVYGTGIYVKNGDVWKLAFTMNSPD